MKKLITFLFSASITLISYTQSVPAREEALLLGKEAIKLMDNGDIDKSIELLEKASKLDPGNYRYPYEIGYAYYLTEDYARSVKIYEKIIEMDDIDDQCYQMLGNAYDLNKQPKKAIETYNKGLKKFPNSGILYLELGTMHQDDLNEALDFYEKGIKVDPQFPSNYYRAARIFCNSTEELWGMIYGEIFMNIERGSDRTKEISKLLFDTYFSQIKFTSDTSASVSFSKNMEIDINNTDKLPFGLIYEPSLLVGITGDTITLETLNQIRKRFIEFYFEKGFNKTYPNVLFDWNKELIDSDRFECYNYWLLMQGATDEFNSWYALNKEKFDAFIEWFKDNPMVIDETHRFNRSDY
jgi:tetratricopeptide (TPR) repeat protein